MHVFPVLKPDYMLLTNLFSDQLDRYGEIDITMNILEEMIRTVPDMKLIVNGDDALSAYMAMDSGNPCVYYGISRPVMKNETNEIREGRFCKKCGERLQYSFYHYSQLGDYQCPNSIMYIIFWQLMQASAPQVLNQNILWICSKTLIRRTAEWSSSASKVQE